MDSWASFINKALYPLWEQKVKRRPILDYLQTLNRTQYAHPKIIEKMQVERMQVLLRHANQNVPYYKDLWRQNNIDIESFTGLKDLEQIPILTRQKAKSSVETRRSNAGPPIAVNKVTGGTTGEPLKIQYDQESEYRRQAMKQRGFSWAGYKVGLPVLHYWGVVPTLKQDPLKTRAKKFADHLLKREKWIDCTLQGDDYKKATIEIIKSHQPKVIFCYAQALVELAKFINSNNLRDWGDITIVCGAEKVFLSDRAILQKAFGPHVYETYGCCEFMLIATECSEHDGMHLSMEHLIVEIVDDNGKSVPDGDTGNVVITDLYNHGSPLIRYQNGDLAAFEKTHQTCGCGRTLKKIRSIEGRKTESLKDQAGNTVGGMIFNLIFSVVAEEVSHFQVRQKKDLSIVVSVVSDNDLSVLATTHIEKQCKKYLPGILVELKRVAEIPLTKRGKRQIVIVE